MKKTHLWVFLPRDKDPGIYIHQVPPVFSWGLVLGAVHPCTDGELESGREVSYKEMQGLAVQSGQLALVARTWPCGWVTNSILCKWSASFWALFFGAPASSEPSWLLPPTPSVHFYNEWPRSVGSVGDQAFVLISQEHLPNVSYVGHLFLSIYKKKNLFGWKSHYMQNTVLDKPKCNSI